jgi:hypothetical protein
MERNSVWSDVVNEGFTRMDRGIERLGRFWGAGFFLLLNTFWMLFAGGVTAVFARSARIREGLPCRPAVRWGVIYTAIYPGLYFGAASLSEGIYGYLGAAFLSGSALALVVAVLPFVALKRDVNWRGYVGRLGWFMGTIAGLYLVTASIYGSTLGLMNAVFEGYDCGDPLMLFRLATAGHYAIAFFLAAIVPLLTLISLAIRARGRHVPASVGMARGLRRLAVPLAATMLFAYVVTVLLTVAEEALLSATIQRMAENEKQYLVDAGTRQ